MKASVAKHLSFTKAAETLFMTQPAVTSHAGMSREDRQRLGITDGLVRMSVGLEATEDIVEDFAQALGK